MCKDLWVQLQWYAVQLGTTSPSKPATPLKPSQGSGFTVQRLQVHSQMYQIPWSHPLTLCSPPVFSISLDTPVFWLDDMSQHLSDGCGSAVGVFAVVFSEGAALQKIPLRVEQATHTHASLGGVAWLTRVQGVHWHLGGSGSRVAAFPQRRGISAGGLGRSHAGATAKAVAIRGYATESRFLNQLGAGLGS